MSFMDKAKKMMSQHDKKIDEAVEKAGDMIDEKTGGKHADKVNKAQDFIQEKTGNGDTAGRDATRSAQQHDPRE